ncbi:hypothetical protein ABZU25_26265 [Micromonospora sp. NPDC005215]|uniref:hypothetical protein n=1 Tax=Micromonospora sp. NPDC005215 TaxID=3157024 RepID=UPI0033BCF1B1
MPGFADENILQDRDLVSADSQTVGGQVLVGVPVVPKSMRGAEVPDGRDSDIITRIGQILMSILPDNAVAITVNGEADVDYANAALELRRPDGTRPSGRRVGKDRRGFPKRRSPRRTPTGSRLPGVSAAP